MPQQIEKVPLSKCSEEQIAELVIAWLEEQHWEIYQEVSFWYGGGAVDIIAKKEYILWAIEVKKKLNFEVISQAHNNARFFHFSSIAVPAPSRKGYYNGRAMAKMICQDYGIGVIELDPTVAFDGITHYHKYNDEIYVNENIPPKLFRKNHQYVKDRLLPSLMPEHKTYAKAGSKGGARFTPYRATMERIKSILLSHPGITLKEIIDHLEDRHHYSPSSVMTTIRNALSNYEYKWCATTKGKKPYKYYLKESKEYKEYIKRAKNTG